MRRARRVQGLSPAGAASVDCAQGALDAAARGTAFGGYAPTPLIDGGADAPADHR